MRYEVFELLPNCTIDILLTTSSYNYALMYMKFLNYLYRDSRIFYVKITIEKGVNYEKCI